MKRQYNYTVTPSCHASGRNWENKHIFERWGDDNSVYFTNEDQLLMSNGLLGHGGTDWSHSSKDDVILSVPAGHTVTTFLCEEARNVKRTIRLEGPGAQAKIFVDAWEHYQTVPLIVQAAGVGSAVAYQWSFHNYIPISSPGPTGPTGAPLSGKGVASYFPNVNLSPPIVQTLGSTDRTPMGEHPVSDATKRKTCSCAEERPYFLISHTDINRSNGPLLVVIKVAQ